MTPDELKTRTNCRARSRAGFIHKMSGAVEEVDESALWLEILTEAGISPKAQAGPLWTEADELTRIFVRSRKTARAKRDRAATNKSPIENRHSTTNEQSRIKDQE